MQDKQNCQLCTICYIKTYKKAFNLQQSPPQFCAMLQEKDILHQAANAYFNNPELKKLAIASAQTEAAGYMRNTRIEEIMDFARRLGVKKIKNEITELKLPRSKYAINKNFYTAYFSII